MLIGEGEIGEDKDHLPGTAGAFSNVGILRCHGNGVPRIDRPVVFVLIPAIQTYSATEDNV
jgi:hypothetical protein